MEYSLKEFQDKFLKDSRFQRLYKEWIKSGCKKETKPTVDRINSKLGYTISNIQCLTWAENRYKQRMERRCRKGKVIQMLGDKVIKIFKSQKEAVAQTGLNQGQMSKVLNGKGETCGGYKFVYENPELLTPSGHE